MTVYTYWGNKDEKNDGTSVLQIASGPVAIGQSGDFTQNEYNYFSQFYVLKPGVVPWNRTDFPWQHDNQNIRQSPSLPAVTSLPNQQTASGNTQFSLLAALLKNPNGLRRARGTMGKALRSRFDIVCIGNSITEGQGSTGNNIATPDTGAIFTASDNYLGWVGQLRTLLNAPLGIDPGEGFVSAQDSRAVKAGGGVNSVTLGVMHQGVSLPNASATLTITPDASGSGVPNCAYVGIVLWDQVSGRIPTVTVNAVAQTMKTAPGGSTNLALTGSNNMVVGYVPATNGQAVVVTGHASGSFLVGFDFVGSTVGFHVHRMGVPGDITADLVGGAVQGSVIAAASTAVQDRVIRSAYQWLAPGLLIVSHMDVNDFQLQNNTRTLTVQFVSTTAFTVVGGGALDATDVGHTTSGTNISASTVGVVTDTTHGIITGGTYSGTQNQNTDLTITNSVSQSGMTPALAAACLSQFLNNTGAGSQASSGALTLGWSALILAGPRANIDGNTPSPAFIQSAYIAAMLGVINSADANYGNVAGLDLSNIWGSTVQAHSDGLQLANSIHPSLAGHGDIARTVEQIIRNFASLGAVTANVPA